MKLEATNIGGFTGTKTFDIKKGLNLIKAPNASGKTSFIHALETMVLPERILRDKRHFLNYFFLSGTVSLLDEEGKEWSRILRSGDGKLIISGSPYWPAGEKAVTLSFAIPGNSFMEKIQAALPLERTFEELSGSSFYRNAILWLEKQKVNTLNRLRNFREELIRLENLKNEIDNLNKELLEYEKEKSELPSLEEVQNRVEINEELIKNRRKLTELEVNEDNYLYIIENNTEKISRLEENIEHLKNQITSFEEEHPNIQKEIEELQKEIENLKKDTNNLILQQSIMRLQLDLTRTNIIQGKRYQLNECLACGKTLSIKEIGDREQYIEKEFSLINKQIADIRTKTSEYERAREEILAEEIRIKRDIRQQLADDTETLTKLEKEIRAAKSNLDNLKENISDLHKNIEEFEKTIDLTAIKIIQKHGELNGKIQISNNRINRIKQEIERLSYINTELINLEINENFLTKAISHMSDKEVAIKDSARLKFNKRINEIYQYLRFRDFENIEIDDFFHVKVRRKLEKRIIEQDIASLSATERLTIAIIAMLAGKEEYLPDFPFFVLDELPNSYDQTRFETIANYLKEIVPYTIITSLTPYSEQEEVKITYEE